MRIESTTRVYIAGGGRTSILAFKPNVIINLAALTDLEVCERDAASAGRPSAARQTSSRTTALTTDGANPCLIKKP